MSLQQIPGLYFAPSDIHGRGVFCVNDLHQGDLIEIAPVISFAKSSIACLDKTKVYEYYFLWGEKMDQPAIALGYGSLFNHNDDPNADFSVDLESESIHFFALKDIAAGTEITTNYRSGRPDQTLWFDVTS
ncbi:MAG: SET domain-containing protein [Bacteroidetes bacterium]|nr:MAG: SET domain-containing protein [Bacteroidota bacterium]